MGSEGGDKSVETLEKSMVDIAVESWRFSRLFIRVLNKLDAGDAARYTNQLRYFQKKVQDSLEANGLRLVDIEGQQYDAGMPAAAVNLADYAPDDVLMVDQMMEPIIMGPEGLRRQGTVTVKKVQP